jgi:hypothetical protein
MEFGSLYPDLEDIFSGRWKEGFNLFYALAQLRYFTPDQARELNQKIGTGPKFQKLQERGYIADNTLTDKAFRVLRHRKFNLWEIQQRLRGSSEHGFYISKVVLELMKRPDYFFVFYPTFKEPPDYQKEYLRPDFCLVLKDGSRGKLIFGEVEEPKPNWEAYLSEKMRKYEAIAKDQNLHALWWKTACVQKGLVFCDQSEFGFSVKIYKDGEEWKFNEF